MKKIVFENNDKTSLTKEEIEGFKKEYGGVFLITVEDKKCYLHTPTRVILDAAHAASAKRSSKYNEVVIRSCWLAGDKIILDDDEYFLSASTHLDEMITFKEAGIKKL